MIGRLAEISLAQPVDDCLKLLGRFLCGGKGQAPVVGSFWQPANLLGGAAAGSDKVISPSPEGSATPHGKYPGGSIQGCLCPSHCSWIFYRHAVFSRRNDRICCLLMILLLALTDIACIHQCMCFHAGTTANMWPLCPPLCFVFCAHCPKSL